MNKQKKLIFWIIGLLTALIFSVIISILIGSVKLPLDLTLGILLNKLSLFNIEATWTSSQEAIIWNLRLPRIILSVLIGAMLAVSGTAFQGILRNPLADPYILGISSGAALGAATSILFFPNIAIIGSFTLPLFALVGSVITLGVVLALTNIHNQRGNEVLILAGVIVQAFTGAILTFLIAISGEQMQTIIFWMMGSLANKDWLDVLIIIPYFLIGIMYLITQTRELNVLVLGEQSAAHLGMDVEKKKLTILFAASILSASAVSIVGIIGFVGLIIPHLVRLLVGSDHRVLLPISILAGAIFLLWTDTLARSLISSREIPIGVITALIGAPFFAFLLRRGLRRRA